MECFFRTIYHEDIFFTCVSLSAFSKTLRMTASRRTGDTASGTSIFRQIGIGLLAITFFFLFAIDFTGGPFFSNASAAELPAPATATESPETATLPAIVVHGRQDPLTDASKTVDKTIIDRFPRRNGNINEILSFLPDIQYSETANLSTQGGEIIPSAVSIAGGKSFENNFMIDGLGNNSLLDPDADNPLSHDNVPGHAQQIFLDASLVDRITLHDSNVPASLGDFKGGVVQAATIEPGHEFGGSLFYRTTRDAWTEFHIAPSEKTAFENSEDHKLQPKFKKHHAGFDIHLPVTSHLRLLAAYRLQIATIPLRHLGESRNQQRRNETFLIKLASEPTRSSELSLSWVYSPYEGRYFKKDYLNSDFTIFGGAYMANTEYRTALPFADLRLQAGYTEGENSREGPPDLILTQKTDGSWKQEGFVGDLEKKQQTFQFKTDLEFHRFLTGTVSHEINTGFDLQHIRGTSRRDETSYLYYYYLDGSAKRKVFKKHQAQATLRQLAFYIEDILHYRRLEVRPGLRLSYDDFMRNFNLAPRLAAAFDVFGNGRTVLVGGINRYYASTLLTYKLRDDTPSSYWEQRPSEGSWTFWKNNTTATSFASLKTPYADEYVIGLEQHIFGGKAVFKYVQRQGKDAFGMAFSDRQPDGFWYYSLDNNGRSRHESYRLSWEGQWRNHYLSLSGTYQETTSSNESYDELWEQEDLDEDVWYDGQILSKSQLPRKDFNRPWLVSLLYIGQFPYGITFSSLLKYRSGYQALEDTHRKHEELGIPIYEKVKRGGAITIDCTIDWRTFSWRGQQLVLNLEILNLLNKKVATGEDSYELGRQVWLGAKYYF